LHVADKVKIREHILTKAADFSSIVLSKKKIILVSHLYNCHCTISFHLLVSNAVTLKEKMYDNS